IINIVKNIVSDKKTEKLGGLKVDIYVILMFTFMGLFFVAQVVGQYRSLRKYLYNNRGEELKSWEKKYLFLDIKGHEKFNMKLTKHTLEFKIGIVFLLVSLVFMYLSIGKGITINEIMLIIIISFVLLFTTLIGSIVT